MWDKFKKVAGYVWASPVTACGLLYSGVFQMMGWHKWHGVVGDALVWRVDYLASPMWLRRLWSIWSGHAIGNVVVMNCDPDKNPVKLTHELIHVQQCMRLGVFHPIAYAIILVVAKVGCRNSHPYYDNILEIDARRGAGQVIDVVGALKKLREMRSTQQGSDK